jgi:hypothetical protein
MKINDNVYHHPNTIKSLFEKEGVVEETGLFKESSTGLIEDRLYVGVVDVVDEEKLGSVVVIGDSFKIATKTPEEVVVSLKEFYPKTGEKDSFELDEDGFSLVDNRELPTLGIAAPPVEEPLVEDFPLEDVPFVPPTINYGDV